MNAQYLTSAELPIRQTEPSENSQSRRSDFEGNEATDSGAAQDVFITRIIMLRSFIDAMQREWTVEFDDAAIARVFTASNGTIDMRDASRESFEWTNDPAQLNTVLTAVIFDQITALGLTPEQVAPDFNGDTMIDARLALTAAATDHAKRVLSGVKRELLWKKIGRGLGMMK
jgi:hypothetical protein